MPPCHECTLLWNDYTNLRIKYRIALGGAKPPSNLDDGALDRMRDASELARRTFQEHELTHAPKQKPPETMATANTPAQQHNSKGAAILLPPVSQRAAVR